MDSFDNFFKPILAFFKRYHAIPYNRFTTKMYMLLWRDQRSINSIQFNHFHHKIQQNIKEVCICTQQDGGGTTKSKSLKILKLNRSIQNEITNSNKHKQATI